MLKSPRLGVKYAMRLKILRRAPNIVHNMITSFGTIGRNPFSFFITVTWVMKQLFKLINVDRMRIVSGFMGIPRNVV